MQTDNFQNEPCHKNAKYFDKISVSTQRYTLSEFYIEESLSHWDLAKGSIRFAQNFQILGRKYCRKNEFFVIKILINQ